MKELQRQHSKNNAHDDIDSIDDLIKQNAGIIPIPDGMSIEHPKYTTATTEVSGVIKKYLIRTRAAQAVVRKGSDDPDIGLEETTKVYLEHRDKIEKPLIEQAGTDVHTSVVGQRIYDAHENYLVTKLVRGGNNPDEEIFFDEKTMTELSLDKPYVQDRIRAMAASALGETTAELKESGANLSDIIMHVDRTVKTTEKITGKEFEQVFCYAHSHYEIRNSYKTNEGENVRADGSLRSCNTGTRTLTTKVDVTTFDPNVQKYEDEIVEYHKEQVGEENVHPEYRQLVRTAANLQYILPADKTKALPTHPPEGAYDEDKS